MAQKDIWGEWQPEHKVNIAKLAKELAGGDSATVTRLTVAQHPHTKIMLLKLYDLVVDHETVRRPFVDWICRMSFETCCRTARKLVNGDGAQQQAEAAAKQASSTSPTWYQTYMRTQHIEGLRRAAVQHFGSCVLCGSLTAMQLHHRNYDSLGNEQMRDVSVLCNTHHMPVHHMLALRIPRTMPDGVKRIFKKEGVRY